MFLAPLLLMGLIAIGVPLWLHRVARANPLQHPFPSLMLLEASETQRTAKRTLRYWLLLLLRILLIVVLALAFAGPLLQKRADSLVSSDARLHAIVLDTSLSMQHGERWPRALEAVESVLETLRSTDRVMLVSAAGRGVSIAHEAVNARDAGALRATLRTLQPGNDRLDFGFVMNTAEQWLATPRPPVLMHLISDFQRTGAPLRFSDLQPPTQTQLVMHDIGANTLDNAYIENATLGYGDTRALEVGIRSTNEQPQRRDLVLAIDGKEVARRTVDLPAWSAAPPRQRSMSAAGEGGRTGSLSTTDPLAQIMTSDTKVADTTAVVFDDLRFSPGAHRVELKLEPQDALPQDDRHAAVIEHTNPKALLLARTAEGEDAAYFASAIGALTAPRLSVERKSAGTFEQIALSEYALLVVPDLFALSSAAAARLEEYVSAGGALLTTLGPGKEGGDHSLFHDWRIGQPRVRAATLGAIETSHPILRDAESWHRVRFFRQRMVSVPENDRVLIAHADDTPLLVERTVGAGRMLVLTAAVDRSWNDLAIHPVFVQFIAEAARYLIGDDSSAASFTVGTPVTTGLTRVAGGQIFGPTGKRVLELAATANAERFVPTELGFYEIRHANGSRWVAVNSDRRESDLRRMPSAFLARWQALRERSATRSAPAAAVTRTQEYSLGPMLLWIAAVLLLAELLMANRYLAVRRERGRAG